MTVIIMRMIGVECHDLRQIQTLRMKAHPPNMIANLMCAQDTYIYIYIYVYIYIYMYIYISDSLKAHPPNMIAYLMCAQE